jgi:hypothetical protein
MVWRPSIMAAVVVATATTCTGVVVAAQTDASHDASSTGLDGALALFPPHRASASGTVEVWAALSSTSGCIAVVGPMSEEGVAGHMRSRADHHTSGRGRGDSGVDPLCDVVTTVSNATHKVMSTTPLTTSAPITPWGRVRHAAMVNVSGWHGAVNISVDVVTRADSTEAMSSRAVVSQVWPFEVRLSLTRSRYACLFDISKSLLSVGDHRRALLALLSVGDHRRALLAVLSVGDHRRALLALLSVGVSRCTLLSHLSAVGVSHRALQAHLPEGGVPRHALLSLCCLLHGVHT